MNVALFQALVCPLDHAPLELTPTAQDDNSIETGTLACTVCGESYPVVAGVPHMLSARLPGIASKLGEVQGWVDKARQEDWYGAQDEQDLALPYVVEKLGWDPRGAQGWVATRHSLEHLFAEYVKPGMRVLEVGAAKTWAGHYFLERDCAYTGSDILDDPFIGVGRARFFMSRFGGYDALVADGEALPFHDGWFDLVFGIQVLHHALDLDRMVSEMARVTRSGGCVSGLNEGVRAQWASSNAEQQAGEKQLGINEHVRTLGDYQRAFARNGLKVLEIKRAVGDELLLAPRLKRMLDGVRALPRLGAPLAVWLVLNWIHAYDGVSLFASKVG